MLCHYNRHLDFLYASTHSQQFCFGLTREYLQLESKATALGVKHLADENPVAKSLFRILATDLYEFSELFSLVPTSLSLLQVLVLFYFYGMGFLEGGCLWWSLNLMLLSIHFVRICPDKIFPDRNHAPLSMKPKPKPLLRPWLPSGYGSGN